MKRMKTSPRHVLVVGADRNALDRVAPMLRRGEFDVHTVAESSLVLDLLQSTSFELLVVAYPTREISVDDVLNSVRSEESTCRHAGILLLASGDKLDEAQQYLERGANRAVSTTWATARLWQVVGDLMNVAPRVFIRALVDIDVETGMNITEDLCRTENISESGMLLHGAAAYPSGTNFDFAFALPGSSTLIEGAAEIVRSADLEREGVSGFGARFVSIRGNGRELIDAFITEQMTP